ncbi:outer membrane receptor protein involved in Fe transport [Neolewinella xylanilytica]|uniref:Outer membrane receptor protein involved in Fe transport n=1 Tax=Neolewinella xylanilytica TaxID=1514080 RepID=A0A2S6IB23_9BACT|nr:TonB-dependent receptor [Neolewinella xylanilytica]PPK88713.1 outer membrane receptor protein involved in Fe transport [Neolewinella xylanilytica]
MKRVVFVSLLLWFSVVLSAQYHLSGNVSDADGAAIPFANVALYLAADSSLVKVETTNDLGSFDLANVPQGEYDLVISYVGTPDLRQARIILSGNRDLGTMAMARPGVDLTGATVTAQRALVEVKPDRTIFNVQGTINAAGSDGLELLRKAPGVSVDNSDNISVLSRSGVLVYVDGRNVPLQGADLSNYLRNLTAEQIERIDIITSPGARYEAQGNAGIIDIRLKKAEDEGANGSMTAAASQGRYARYAVNVGGNYRNDRFNLFGNLSYGYNQNFSQSNFTSRQRSFLLIDDLYSVPILRTPGIRTGLDVYLGDRHTVGILFTGQYEDGRRVVNNSTEIYERERPGVVLLEPDSILRAQVFDDGDHNLNTFNVNYNFAIGAGHNLNLDLDYGRYRHANVIDQPNRYFSPGGQLLSVSDNSFDTPIDITIHTARLDYNLPIGKGAASAGAKYSGVETSNTFLFYQGLSGDRTLIAERSNLFHYDESVFAGYLSYGGQLSESVSFSAGVRMEVTDAAGTLTAVETGRSEPSVDFNYVSFFPNAGLTYSTPDGNTINLRYGRRINRPDYSSLNPFRVQLNELSYRRGNPFLQPEKVNNVELGYVLGGRYNFKLAYSRTDDQVAQLFSPDDSIALAGFETYDNLARQTVVNFTASAPIQITAWWRSYLNASAGYISNEADYGEGGIVDIDLFNYRFYNQNTFTLPAGFTGEITGQYIGPGVGGGIFVYDGFGVVNLGLQRRLLADKLTAKLTVSDIFYTSIINGESNFNGLIAQGRVAQDTRRVGLSLSYNFGNQKVKVRSRDTGLDEAAGRVH